MSDIFGKCNHPSCPKTARWQIGFRVWPAGTASAGKKGAVEGLTSVCVCDEHAIRNPETFYTPRRKQELEMAFLQAGRGMPDFRTAQVIHTEIAAGFPIGPEEAQRLGGFADTVTQ